MYEEIGMLCDWFKAASRQRHTQYNMLFSWNTCKCWTQFLSALGSKNNKTYHLIEQTLSWESAKSYCRTNYIDLAMIENEEENQKVLSIITTYVWIGLYRVPWTFSDGTNSSFRHWWSYEPNNVNNNQLCVGLYDGGFSDMECTTTFPFICSGKLNIHMASFRQPTFWSF